MMKKSEQTRGRLLEAALRVISRKGYSAATVDEIVKEAGVSKGVAYYHFKSKEEIGSSILDIRTEQIFEDLKSCAVEKDAAEALAAMLGKFVDIAFDDRSFTRFLMNELWREGRTWSTDMRQKIEAIIELLAEQVERGKADGLFRESLDPTFVANGILGLIITDTLYATGPDGEPTVSKDQFRARIADFVSHALLR